MTTQQNSDRRTADRIPNKTIWGLEDSIVLIRRARQRSKAIRNHARQRHDEVLGSHLNLLDITLSDLELTLVRARNGQYERTDPDES